MIKQSLTYFKSNYHYIAFLSLLGYALFKYANRAVGDVFLTILLLGFIVALFKDSLLRKDTMLKLFLAAVIVSVVSFFLNKNSGDYRPDHFSISPLGNLFYFVILGYFLQGNLKKTALFLIALCLGITLSYILNSGDFLHEFALAIHGERVDFGLVNANHTAAVAGVAMVLSGIFLYWLVAKPVVLSSKGKIAFVLFAVINLVINTIVVYGTKSREVWLALLLVFILALCFLLYHFLFQQRSVAKLIVLLGASSVLLFSAYHQPEINKRVTEEIYIINDFIHKDVKDIPSSSTGLRIKFVYSAFPWIEKHPVFGMGHRDARDFVIEKSTLFDQDVKKNYSHLHNGFVEVLVGYGIMGLLVVLGIYTLLIGTVVKAAPQQYKAFLLFASIAFVIYFSTINMFESFLFFKTGEYIQTALLAAIYTFVIKRQWISAA